MIRFVVFVLVLLAIAAPGVDAATIVHEPLLSSGGADRERGDAKLVVRGRGNTLRAALRVRARKLTDDTVYDVTVDGVRIGSFTTSRRGTGKIRFRTKPSPNSTLLGVDPRGRVIAVVSSRGKLVLSAALPLTGIDPGDVRCCLPDDSGTECEDRTAAECTAQGGVNLGGGSCLPNPCAGAVVSPGGTDVRCCTPDDSGPHCEDRTVNECAAEGGINVGTGVCLPTDCALTGGGTGPTTGRIEVTCDARSGRSKVSVDARNLASGSYAARVTSGAAAVTSPLRATVGDEVEFDFDSQPDDIAAGAVALAPTFITGTPPQVTGELLSGAGVVASSTVDCRIDD
ncbi:MAG TPA: hypothetical protein VGR62_03495 [Candidatus Binatia bacterium]|nr:hypothetical protein [Candidatus Binatia bacterium]